MKYHTAVLGIYSTRPGVEAAIETLRDAGFRHADISILFPEDIARRDPGLRDVEVPEKTTKAPEAAAAGAGTGAVIGGALGWLAGIGALAIPGVGPFVAAGPMMAALAGATAGGTVGVIAGSLVGMGIPEEAAKRYEGRVHGGGILLSVHCDTSAWAVRAQEIMERTGAEDVSTVPEAERPFDKPLPRTGTED